jgi:4-diphosphocytidyl-2-C-methyl-D-erythritol kinase
MSQGAGAAFAAAKVNLCLHVGPRGADGYHPIASLMVCADVGDRLAINEAGESGLRITGAFAGGLSAGADNLVARAASAFAAASGAPAPGLILDKALPIGAGLGGGSADAAAALRLLNAGAARALAADALKAIAERLGADVVACLESAPMIAEGRGERVAPAPAMPVLDAVLVHPGQPSSTPQVYAAFDEMAPAGRDLGLPATRQAFGDLDAVLGFLNATRNDLQAPAIAHCAVIGEALDALAREREALFVRMTGSGSAVFAVCPDRTAAAAVAERLSIAYRGWWIRPCRLGGPQTA